MKKYAEGYGDGFGNREGNYYCSDYPNTLVLVGIVGDGFSYRRGSGLFQFEIDSYWGYPFPHLTKVGN